MGFKSGPERTKSVRPTGKWVGDKYRVEEYVLAKFEGSRAGRRRREWEASPVALGQGQVLRKCTATNREGEGEGKPMPRV